MKRIAAYLLGMYEFRRSVATHYGPDLIETYDSGRERAHKLTLRHYDK